METIHFFVEDVSFNPVAINHSKEWIAKVIAQEGHALTELNYIFCSDNYLLSINQTYLNHDTYTDIITFNNSDTEKNIEADIFISIDRVKENADNFNTEFFNELYRVMVHGVLHLLGYNDHSKEDIKIIRQKEDSYLSLM